MARTKQVHCALERVDQVPADFRAILSLATPELIARRGRLEQLLLGSLQGCCLAQQIWRRGCLRRVNDVANSLSVPAHLLLR